MIKGFYAAASAMVANMNRQTALAHNIANLDTPGFRQILYNMEDWYVTPSFQASEEILPAMDVNHIHKPGYIGLGTQTTLPIDDFSQGAVKSTGQEFDFSINGTGFFRVRTDKGERYTRDGRFHRDANNQLVTVEGYNVLDNNGQPITLPTNTTITVDETGTMYQTSGATAGQIGLAAFTDPNAELKRDGNNIFAAAGGVTGTNPGTINQGYLEMSNGTVDALMSQMVIVGRAYEAAQRIVQMEDDTTGKLISYIGR